MQDTVCEFVGRRRSKASSGSRTGGDERLVLLSRSLLVVDGSCLLDNVRAPSSTSDHRAQVSSNRSNDEIGLGEPAEPLADARRRVSSATREPLFRPLLSEPTSAAQPYIVSQWQMTSGEIEPPGDMSRISELSPDSFCADFGRLNEGTSICRSQGATIAEPNRVDQAGLTPIEFIEPHTAGVFEMNADGKSTSPNVSLSEAQDELLNAWFRDEALSKQTRPQLTDNQALYQPPELMTPAEQQDLCEMALATFGDSDAALLFQHYTYHMVCLMQPISHRHSPFKNIYLRLAIQGSREVAYGQAASPGSLARRSIYHSVLACAALNIQSLTLDIASHFHRLACYHRSEGLKAARDALADKSSSYKELMTAILAMVSVDVSDRSLSK